MNNKERSRIITQLLDHSSEQPLSITCNIIIHRLQLIYLSDQMDSSTLNSSTDYFILDRNQDAVLVNPCAQSTPKALGDNCENIQSLIIEDIYEIINTGTEHIVLYHESAPLSILATAQSDTLPSRKFTNSNPIIPDDDFMSHKVHKYQYLQPSAVPKIHRYVNN